MAAVRQASVIWQGDLMSGKGSTSAETSKLFSGLPVSWGSRTEEPNGQTSPEELLAAAHASCFSMALSNGLAQAGHPPQELRVSASVTFDKRDAGWRVVSSEIEVKGRVAGVDEAAFREAAETARDNCPISQALKGNVELSVRASLL